MEEMESVGADPGSIESLTSVSLVADPVSTESDFGTDSGSLESGFGTDSGSIEVVGEDPGAK